VKKGRTSKTKSVDMLRGVLGGVRAAVVAEHRGLPVAEVTNLRKKLREAGAEFRVVKNTLVRLAAQGTDLAGLDGSFSGPTAIATAKGDPVAMAKAIKDFAAGSPKIALKAGYLDGKVLSVPEVQALAEVPPREVLLARLAAGLLSPVARLTQALSGPQRKLVYALDAVRNQRSV
jgi:large subunit ribosomal protein L10